MITDLSKDEKKLLDAILKHIPLKDIFHVGDLYYVNFIITKYPSSFSKLPNGGIGGYNPDAQKEQDELQNAYTNITEFLVEKDFANREGAKIHRNLKLTDKGSDLCKCGNLDYYEGWEFRKKCAVENRDILIDEYYQSQIDFRNAQIESQEKQNELWGNQIQTNNNQIEANNI